MSSYRITILCENSVGPVSGTLGEHGFAALVEGVEGSVLFDTGSGETLLHNALRMNRDLRRTELVALSHGHHDHAGGLLPLLRTCGAKEVLAHPGIFARRYRVKDTGESYSIGIPYDEAYLRGVGARFSFAESFREILPEVFLTGAVPRTTRFEKGDAGLFCDASGCAADPLTDDQSLVLRTERGLVLLLGCCHAGLVNTLEHARERCGEERVYAVVGGTHLGFSSPEQVDATVAALKKLGVARICGGHCTGFEVSARLRREFPAEFHPANVGFTLEV